MSSCTVVSLLPFPLDEPKHGLMPTYYNIDAAESVKKPAVLVVGYATRFVYLDYERGSLPITVLPQEIAHAIVDDFCRAQLAYRPSHNPNSAPGLFWVEGSHDADGVVRSFPKEVEKARREQMFWFMELVKIADDDWSKYHSHAAIGERQRFAAKALNLSREWLFEPKPDEMQNCKFCTLLISSNAIVCPNCRQVLDIAKFEAMSKG